jgi:hypothetical protein
VLENALLMLLRMWDRRAVPRFRSIAKIQAFHDEVAGDYEVFVKQKAERLKREIAGAFRAPPIPGTDIIVPITSEVELRKEGRKQRNCVGGYAPMVRGGGCYIYQVLEPVRATLSIVPGSDGDWRISELKAKANSLVSCSTTNTVKEWLYKYALSA